MTTNLKNKLSRFFLMGNFILLFPTLIFAETIGLFVETSSPQIKFAANDVKSALESKGFTVEMKDLSKIKSAYSYKKIVVALLSDKKAIQLLATEGGNISTDMGEQAYAMRTTTKPQQSFWVIGGDANGAMYGGLQLAEYITFNGLSKSYDETVSPDFKDRGAKLNLSMDRRIPTYSGHMNNTSTQHAIKNVWDMKFWETWIDIQARNKYNVLSVWVHHPFPALVKVPGYEKACLPYIEGFFGYADTTLTIDKRIAFWKQVIDYAHNRGFKFYFFCWNVAVDYASDQYPEIERNENCNATVEYLGKCMTALLNTFPELDGFGISAGDNMKQPKDLRPAWTWKSYGKSAYDYAIANPDRKFAILHRGLGTALTSVYKDWEPLTKLPNFKFDYSVKYANAHMYSTFTPKWYDDDLLDAANAGQKTWLTLRNDDYFYMDMGDPEFVRSYLKNIPYRQVINSFYIGSDIYHPTRTYWCKDSTMNGQLEIERNWYIQMLWGRIAYNKNISDDVFKMYLAKRFPQVSSDTLFNAWALASKQLPKVQELTQGSWGLDAHWYAEASMYPKNRLGFRYLDDFIETKVARSSSSNLCSIKTSAADSCGTSKSSCQLADEMESDAKKALELINNITINGNKDLEVKINNIKLLSYLTIHFAYKIRAATFKKSANIDKAKETMGIAYCWWMEYTNLMDTLYYGNKFRTVDIVPDWHVNDQNQLKDYNDLGGVGVPSFDK